MPLFPIHNYDEIINNAVFLVTWSRGLKFVALNSHYVMLVRFSVSQCVGSVPTEHRETLGLLLIFSVNPGPESQQPLGD